MKKKFLKSIFTLSLLVAFSNFTFADVITPGQAISMKMSEGIGPILLALMGIAVVGSISVLVVFGMKKQGESTATKTNIEPVFGATPKIEEKMEVNEDEKTNE